MRLLTLSLSLLVLSLPAVAEKETKIEITPIVGYRFGGDFELEKTRQKITLEDKVNYGLLVAWPFDNKRQAEFLISHYQSNFTQNTADLLTEQDISVSYFHLGGNVPMSDGVIPVWLSGGLGLSYLSPKDKKLDDETRFSLNVGMHTRYNVSENLSFRLGGRIYATFFNSNSAIFCDTDICNIRISSDIWLQSEVNAGLTFAF